MKRPADLGVHTVRPMAELIPDHHANCLMCEQDFPLRPAARWPEPFDRHADLATPAVDRLLAAREVSP